MQSPRCGMYCSCTSCYERSILEACTEAECSANDFGTAKMYNLNEHGAHLQPVTELFQMDSEDEEQQSMGKRISFLIMLPSSQLHTYFRWTHFAIASGSVCVF